MLEIEKVCITWSNLLYNRLKVHHISRIWQQITKNWWREYPKTNNNSNGTGFLHQTKKIFYWRLDERTTLLMQHFNLAYISPKTKFVFLDIFHYFFKYVLWFSNSNNLISPLQFLQTLIFRKLVKNFFFLNIQFCHKLHFSYKLPTNYSMFS